MSALSLQYRSYALVLTHTPTPKSTKPLEGSARQRSLWARQCFDDHLDAYTAIVTNVALTLIIFFVGPASQVLHTSGELHASMLMPA